MDRMQAVAMFADVLRAVVQQAAVAGYRYTLGEGVVLPMPAELAPRDELRLRWLHIVKVRGEWYFRLRGGYAQDGCTAAPDFTPGGSLERCLKLLNQGEADAAVRMAGPLVASFVHDPIYQFAREIARAYGWSVWRTIRWGNRYFAWVMRMSGTPRWQRWLYFGAVTLVGHQFAFVGRQARAVREWFGK